MWNFISTVILNYIAYYTVTFLNNKRKLCNENGLLNCINVVKFKEIAKYICSKIQSKYRFETVIAAIYFYLANYYCYNERQQKKKKKNFVDRKLQKLKPLISLSGILMMFCQLIYLKVKLKHVYLKVSSYTISMFTYKLVVLRSACLPNG